MSKATILCVDDTKNNIDLLVELLVDYNVVVSLNAANALEILKEMPIDLILLDIMMPVMDGFELCAIIKKDERIKDIPLLFITAKADEQSIEKGYELGALDYVTKPFKPRELLSRVKTHLKMSDLLHNLQQRINEGVEEIQAQEKLLIAQSKAAAMGEMVDAIAHQWTQPLNLINMRIMKLSYDYEDHRIDTNYIDTLKTKCSTQIHHMLDTLSEFRDFLSTNKKMEIFDAQRMCSGTLELLKDELMHKQIKVSLIEEENFTIDAVEKEFKHILINIINNAKDAFKDAQVDYKEIKIKLLNHKILICDNAGGIDPRVINSLFKKHVSTKKSSGGSGMGLYMSQQIAYKFGAKISVENIQNGACFSITTI